MNGRKRHILVDTNGLLLGVVVHPADLQDRSGGELVCARLAGVYPRLTLVWADSAYTGSFVEAAERHLGARVEVVKRTTAGWQVLPRRWVVERTFGWLGRWRRLSRDWEQLPACSEGWVYLAMIRLMLRRLAAAAGTPFPNTL